MAGRVLLYSGGLDSYCLSKLYDYDILLFVNLGTADNQKELELVKNNSKVKIVHLPLSDWELDNKIIPFRNNFLVLLAAQFGNEITIGATAGDTTKDKDYVFKSQMEGILNYFAIDKHKVNVQEYPYIVHMPFKDISKTEIVRRYYEEWNAYIDLFTESRSCYDSGDKECGKCRSCLRKYVSIKTAIPDIAISNYFENDPKLFLKEFYTECVDKGRSDLELKEILGLL